jgi:hypothetical protein
MPPNVIAAIAGGLVGAVVAMVGWFVTDYQRTKNAERNRQIDYLQRQIWELYAPLSILAAKEQSYRNLRTETCKLVAENRRDEVWWRYTEGNVAPAQIEIYSLLQSKWHLLIDGERPSSFDKVLEHCSKALVLYELDKEGMGNLGGIKAPSMPEEFRGDVERILIDLRAEYIRRLNVKA